MNPPSKAARATLPNNEVPPPVHLGAAASRVRFGENFLEVPTDASDEEIRLTFKSLRKVAYAYQWWVGDLLCAIDRLRGSDRAKAILEEFEVSEASAYRYWKVCRHVEHYKRLKCSTFNHHAVALEECGDVALSLDWVKRASEAKWSVAQLRQQIRASKRPVLNGPPAPEDPYKTMLREICDRARISKRWDFRKIRTEDRQALIEDTEDLWNFLCGLRQVKIEKP